MKKIIMFGLVCVLFIFLNGCTAKISYNAKIVTSNFEFQEEFLLNNKTFGAYFDGERIDDENLSKEKIIIINNQEELDSVFKKFDTIDFTKDIILLHGFTTASNSEYELKKVSLIEKKLIVEYTSKKTNKINPPDASMPDTKWLIIRLNRVDADSVEFNFKP